MFAPVDIIKCTKHPNVQADSYCRLCKKHFCANCKEIHNELLEDHESSIVPPDFIEEEEEEDTVKRCPLHPEYPLELICKDCKSILLSLYYTLSHPFLPTLFL